MTLREMPPLGYFPFPKKSWLITKPEHIERAKELFPDVNITADGHKYLGSFIGNEEATKNFVLSKIEEWTKDLDALAEIARSEPHLAYTAYVFGTSRRWQFLCRTTPGIAEQMKDLEDQIKEKLIPAILGGRQPSALMRSIYSLPVRIGGLGIQDPSFEAASEYEYSIQMTSQLAKAIYNQEEVFKQDETLQMDIRSKVKKLKEARQKDLLDDIKSNCSEELVRLINLSSEKGASSWLTSLPLTEYGFHLNKQHFLDAICMRYDLPIKDAPRSCSCGEAYSVNHCLTCKSGGYVILRHNTVRDTTKDLLTEVCKDVRVEPPLLPITGEELPNGANKQDGARADVSALGFWLPLSRAFFDVKVTNPLAQTNKRMTIPEMYLHHEKQKKNQYNARIIQIERGSFTPLIFSCTGGAGPEAAKFIKELADKISSKRSEDYSQTVSFIRRKLRFDILRTCVISLRGERKSRKSRALELKDMDIGLCNLTEHVF